MFSLDRKSQTINLRGNIYTISDILSNNTSVEIDDDFGQEILSFLREWFSPTDDIVLKTSGSTGVPKEIIVKKQYMINSALWTCDFLNLNSNTSALICLPVTAIAGKMMLVRGLISGMKIDYTAPSGHPLHNISSIPDFIAMVPLQVFNSLQVYLEKESLKKIKKIIIGGGFVDKSLENELVDFPNEVYATYGMTETLSHIALRQLNSMERSEYYIPFSSVKLSVTDEKCLVINASDIGSNSLITNDLVELLPDSRFKVLGRKDNVINTGGVKIQMEELELKLKKMIDNDFAITSLADVKFGEIVVLLSTSPIDLNSLELEHFETPKLVIEIDRIPRTRTDKIDRFACKKIANDYRILNP